MELTLSVDDLDPQYRDRETRSGLNQSVKFDQVTFNMFCQKAQTAITAVGKATFWTNNKMYQPIRPN